MRRALDLEISEIQAHFHTLIRERAGISVMLAGSCLPDLTKFALEKGQEVWFPVPGMCGGFCYWFVEKELGNKLLVESWSRTVAGSGQRHEITATGCRLIAKGFV